jgi:glyoxylase-like metal-dependent hydrolase (beta-lactamase superfamily II)
MQAADGLNLDCPPFGITDSHMTQIHRILCPIPFALKTVNCYYLSDTVPTLIDTGVDYGSNLEAIDRVIREAGSSMADLKRIILTHAHTDHLGLAGRLSDISQADIYIHCLDEPKVIRRNPTKSDNYMRRFRDFLVSAGIPDAMANNMRDILSDRLDELISPIHRLILLSGGETFQFDDFRLQVIHTPGHTAGSICLYNQSSGELFSGDTLLKKITPNPVAEFQTPEGDPDYRSIPRYLSSLDKIRQLAVDNVLPGHGSAFRDSKDRIAALKDHIDHRKQVVMRLMRDSRQNAPEGLTLYRLARKMFPNLKGLEVFLGLSEAYAYIQLLESEGRIETSREKDIRRYQLNADSHPKPSISTTQPVFQAPK